MAKKTISWKPKGMNRDVSPSAFNAEFTFENINLRLATNEGNTMMSWVNERGPKAIEVTELTKAWDGTAISSTLQGTCIGTAVLNHQLVLFTTDANSITPDRIYVLKYSNDAKTTMTGRLLFEGNLNFSVEYPLETMVSYEAEYIQKVYWTDNRNQPRLINIAASESKIAKWNADSSVQSFFFDFVPSFTMKGADVTITKKVSSGGLFAPGVIQYVFTYLNKYGQESNIAYLSTLHYLAHSDRGASPEEKVTSSFVISINNADTDFDYVRIYSIQRTSINVEPFVKKLDDIPITAGTTLTYVDNGTNGSTVDPTELLYIGGKEIKALTMTDKDNTLFIGNITQKNSLVTSIQDYYDTKRTADNEDAMGITFQHDDGTLKISQLDHTDGIYSHTNTLNQNLREITTFKGGETYRFGFQLQKKTGEWVEPIFLNDVKNDLYPKTSVDDNMNLVYAKADIDVKSIAETYDKNISSSDDTFYTTFKNIRPVIVFPTIGDRTVLCQGVLNPTVFNAEDRLTGTPYAQASWFFRPYVFDSISKKTAPVDNNTLGISITKEHKGTDADTRIDNSINEFFKTKGYLRTVYASIVNIKEEYVKTYLSRGYLYWFQSQTVRNSPDETQNGYFPADNYEKQYFLGAVKIEDYTGEDGNPWVACLLLSVAPFQEEIHTENTDSDGTITNEDLDYVDEGVEIAEIGTTAFRMYNKLSVSTTGLYFYEALNNNNAPSAYEFMLYVADTLFTISFKSLGEDDESSYEEYSDNDGNVLRFCHYASLYTLDDLTSGSTSVGATDNREEVKQLEIEGAIQTYKSVYGSKLNLADRSETSNTQFFIDQSIVTLNSPDIEFDTEVQSYDTEGLKLRVIGAIPITANVSSHSIAVSSSMLETNHNIDGETGTCGVGEKNINVVHNNSNLSAGQRLISEYLWNDIAVTTNLKKTDGIVTDTGTYNYLVYPWQRIGSMNNDTREKEVSTENGTIYASSYLETKKESHLLFSLNTKYITATSFESISSQIHLTENSEVHNMRLPKQKSTSSEINYYPNIDKVLVNANGYKVLAYTKTDKSTVGGYVTTTMPISMKYKSTSHAVIALGKNLGESDSIPILPYGTYINGELASNVGYFTNPTGTESTTTFWNNKNMTFSQSQYILHSKDGDNILPGRYSFLWLGELYKDVDESSRFGGKSKAAILNNKWLVGGEAVAIEKDTSATLQWTEGDTYYQRYDCLKTYPFTYEDTNQITEILSFMCETHVNIDGRYDKNRGQIRNYVMKPENFNLLNNIYSQQNNFFTSRKVDTEDVEELSYPNHIYYTKTKESGADVDQWTNVTLASTLELDGDKGEITSLNRLNDQIIAFQDKGISQILYNENTQISTTAGVPIEIANSGKVQGKRYLSDTIGCSNKWSIAQTPSGIYFMDNNDKSIYLFNGQLNNLSTTGGFNAWAKQNIPSADIKWNPVDYGNFRTVYDKLNQDVLFISDTTALAFSEKFNCFTSFYNYEHTPFFENFDDTGVWVNGSNIWKHQAGDYCNFFGTNQPFSMTLIANQEPQVDKIFTNLEFRACMSGEGTYNKEKDVFSPTLPFSSLEVWNEYQHGNLTLTSGNNKATAVHGKDTGVLARKFRVWRCDIPRDNAPIDAITESKMGIQRFKVRPLDRIRNPWAYIKLKKEATEEGSTLSKIELHDIMATYFG